VPGVMIQAVVDSFYLRAYGNQKSICYAEHESSRMASITSLPNGCSHWVSRSSIPRLASKVHSLHRHGF